jgi:hypothetical protein
LAVQVTDALPLASVVALVAESAQLAPDADAGAVNVTVAPLSAVPLEVTFATSGAAKAVPTCALWGDPLPAVMFTTVFGCMFEPDEPQLARKPMVRQIRAKPEMRVTIFR